MAARAEAVAKELQEVKGILESKINEMDTKLNMATGEIVKLPQMEAKVAETEKRITEYVNNFAASYQGVSDMFMSKVMEVMAQMADKDVKIAQIQTVIETMAATGGGDKKKKDDEFFDPKSSPWILSRILRDGANGRRTLKTSLRAA